MFQIEKQMNEPNQLLFQPVSPFNYPINHTICGCEGAFDDLKGSAHSWQN